MSIERLGFPMAPDELEIEARLLDASTALNRGIVTRVDAYADSAEHREGLAAFNDKRAPRF